MGEVDRDKRLRAYAWAVREMAKYFPKPDHFILTNFDEMVLKPQSHLSFFRGLPTDPVIIRVWWNDTKSFKYSIVDNYNDLREQNAELVRLLERNGVYVFEQAMT